MVGHHALGVDDPVEPFPYAPEHIKKYPPVAGRPKKILEAVPARRHLILRTGEFQSQWSGQNRKGSFDKE